MLSGSGTAVILVVFGSRHLSRPLQNLKQDVGGGVTPSDKMLEVVKVLWPDKLQQLDLQKQPSSCRHICVVRFLLQAIAGSRVQQPVDVTVPQTQ